MRINNSKNSGFGIIEVLVASTIIAMVIASLVFVARGALTSTAHIHDRTQAANLAAEGIEIVRNIRDSNWIDRNSLTTNWNYWVYNAGWAAVAPGSIYKISYNNNITFKRFVLQPVTTTPETIALKSAGTTSTFTRTVAINSVDELLPDPNHAQMSGQAYKVTVNVKSVDDPKIDVNVSEILTNWRPNF